MYLQINTQDVVVDLSLTPMYVTRNEQSGLTVLTPDASLAIGAVSSDGEIIRYFAKSGVNNTWNTLSDVIFINDEEVPADYENNKYTYTVELGLQPYTGIVPETNEALTEEAIITSDGLLDIAEETDRNITSIEDLITKYELLDARVTALEEKIEGQ